MPVIQKQKIALHKSSIAAIISQDKSFQGIVTGGIVRSKDDASSILPN